MIEVFPNKNGCVICGKKSKYQWGEKKYCFEHFNEVRLSSKETVTITISQEILATPGTSIDYVIEKPEKKRRGRKSKALDV